MTDLPDYLENEWYVVRYSGEIPEIAYHSAIYYLTAAPEGPRLQLSGEDLIVLQQAASERFLEIILRDLTPENRGSTIYRGVKRSIVNYERLRNFCIRQGLEERGYDGQVAKWLLSFLEVELFRASGKEHSAINCSYLELLDFAREIGLSEERLPPGLQMICC